MKNVNWHKKFSAFKGFFEVEFHLVATSDNDDDDGGATVPKILTR